MPKVNLRASQGGAAAIARLKFKAPIVRIERNVLATVPAQETAYCFNCSNGRYSFGSLPPMSCFGAGVGASDVRDMLLAEVTACAFRPTTVLVEWPAPPSAERWHRAAKLAFEGISMLADDLDVPLRTVSQSAIATAFGAPGASREAIIAAARDAGLGWQTTMPSDRECLTAALLWVGCSK